VAFSRLRSTSNLAELPNTRGFGGFEFVPDSVKDPLIEYTVRVDEIRI
jgi:hypothetical protein